MASGTQFASMEPNEMGEMQINIYDRDMQTDELMAIDTIKSDLTLGEYDRKPFTCKHCRRVIIQHFFKSHTLSKL